MDVNDIRIAVTVMGLVLFVALMAHTWSRRRATEHQEAALLPFQDEQPATAHRGEQS
jgi:cytochrome c oxidase cbb3-type subunit IV